MDSFIYALVLVPSLRELLPNSGIAPTAGNVGFYAGYFVRTIPRWLGPIVPVGTDSRSFRTSSHLDALILCYSAFTLAGALSTRVWELGAFRLLAGIGIGGEWTLGGILVAKRWKKIAVWVARSCIRAITLELIASDYQLHNRRALRMARDVVFLGGHRALGRVRSVWRRRA